VDSSLPFADPSAYYAMKGQPADAASAIGLRTTQATAAAAPVALLGPLETTLLAAVTGPTERADDTSYPIWLTYRQGAADHIQMLDGPRGSGLLVPDRYANFLHLKAGDNLALYGPTASTTLPIAGVYRALPSLPDQPWWCDLLPVYRGPEGNRPPPEVILVDQQTLLDLLPKLKVSAFHRVAFPVTRLDLDQDQARQTAAGIASFRKALFNTEDSGFGDDYTNNSKLLSLLPTFTARADLARRSMLPAVVPITAAGVLVGLLVVAAAAVFWVQRRRRELTMLSAHGVGARALGVKAVAESLPALVVGVAAGWGGAWALVHWAGPDPVLSREAAPWAALGAAGTLLAAALVVGVVAGVACRSLTDQVRAHRLRLLRAVPYELALLAGAPLVWRWLGDQRETGDPSNGLGTAVHVPARLLIVPIMVVGGVTVLAARLAVLYLRRGASRREPRSPAAFLGWRRIGRQAVMTAVLAGATSVPIALAAYGATVTGSVRTTIADEARLRIGSDVVLTLNQRTPLPASLAGQATEVLRLDGAIIGGVQTDLLAVDPDTFARDAYWDGRLDGSSLSALMDPIRGGTPTAGPRRIVAAARTPPGVQAATWGGDPVLGGDVEVVSTGVLPAQRTGYPIALVPKDALGDDTRFAVVQLWVRGDPAQIRAAAEAAKLPVKRIQSATDLYANTLWEPLTYTFDYLTALSLLTGVVTLVGLLLYLESQAPLHRRAYVLLRRMGLSAGSHRRALLGELALPLLSGLVGGVAVAAGLTVALGMDFEMNPAVPPDTVIDVPYRPLALIAVAVVAVAVGAASYAQTRIGRADPSEVLRDAI
jgi:putative ABC transport system permease protein